MITPDPDDLTEEQLKASLDKLRTEEGQQEFLESMRRLHDLLSKQTAELRKHIDHLLATVTLPPGITSPDLPRLGSALAEIEGLLAQNNLDALVEAVERFDDFVLFFKGELATLQAACHGAVVRMVDKVSHRFEERRFDLDSESRDMIEDLLQPYNDTFREQILGSLPINERRAIEEEDRRRRESE